MISKITLDSIRRDHSYSDAHGECLSCALPAPCPTMQLLEHYEKLGRALLVLRDVMDGNKVAASHEAAVETGS